MNKTPRLSGNAKWLILAALSSLALLPLIALSEQFAPQFPPLAWLRVVLGFVVVLLCPGYVLQATFLPRAKDLGLPGRLALAFGLSAALLPPIALALSRTPWGIQAWPLLLSLTGLTCLLAALGLIRQRALPPEPPAEPAPAESYKDWWQAQDKVNQSLLVGLAGALVLAGGATLGLMLAAQTRTHFTEFYVLGQAGLGQDYPRVVAAGQPFTLTLGIRNHEGTTVHYQVYAQTPQYALGPSVSLTLADGTTQLLALGLTVSSVSETEPLQLILERVDHPAPYRTLHLWLKPADSP